MKRSELNQIMQDALEFAERYNFKLPPFATWTPNDWESKGSEYNEIKDNMLGWDITDFGSGDYYKKGLLMFTIRNGNLKSPDLKTYAEKLLVVKEEQVTPYHYHWNKMEDIINRGGGILCIKLYNSDGKEMTDTKVLISQDGRNHYVDAGTVIELKPGESITLQTGLYHMFWGKKGHGDILVGEISKVNDDNVDNQFYEQVGRFPEIEEDEAPLYYLFSEYPPICE